MMPYKLIHSKTLYHKSTDVIDRFLLLCFTKFLMLKVICAGMKMACLTHDDFNKKLAIQRLRDVFYKLLHELLKFAKLNIHKFYKIYEKFSII